MSGRSYGAVDSNNIADGRTDDTDNSFVELGIPQLPKLQDIYFGKARRFRNLNQKEFVFVLASIYALLATIVFTIYKLVTVTSSDPDFTFALLLLISSVFCLVYVIHGVLQERPTELFIFFIAYVGVIIYLYTDYFRGKQNDVIELARLIAASFYIPILFVGMFLTYKYYTSGNLIFRTVGANSQLQVVYRRLLFFFDFLRFDLQLSSSMVILILTVRDKVDTEDIVILSVGGVLTLGVFLLGYYSARNERKIGTIVFLIFCLLEPAYIIYKLWQTSREFMYPGLAGSTIACGAMALIVRAIVFITAILVLQNFQQGLKEKVFRSTPMQEANVQGAPDEVH